MCVTFEIDKRPLEQLENDLDKFGERALPYAVRDTLNTAAFKTADLGKKKAAQLFTMRNTFTKRSIQFQKTFRTRINDMESAAGSTQEYMKEQVEGFTRHKKGKHGVPIPTSAAAGQEGASKRTRVIKTKNWLGRIPLAKSRRTRSRRARGWQANIFAVQDAIKSGHRYAMLKKPMKKGIYRVFGGKSVKRGFPEGTRLRMIYSLERSSTRTQEHDWLGPPTRFVGSKIDDYYRAALLRQIERQRLFRDKR